MNYLTPVPIDDPRLTPDLQRTRGGSRQEFSVKGKRTFDPDFTIEAPLRHVFAELIDGKWHWVNGCDECHGREGSWTTYLKCDKHDVCHLCKTPRKELKDIPWGHPKGIECKPCRDKSRAAEKAEALAKFGTYDPWDFEQIDAVKCPYCNHEVDPCHGLYEAEEEETTCDRCDNVFIVTAHPRVEFTMKRKEDQDD